MVSPSLRLEMYMVASEVISGRLSIQQARKKYQKNLEDFMEIYNELVDIAKDYKLLQSGEINLVLAKRVITETQILKNTLNKVASQIKPNEIAAFKTDFPLLNDQIFFIGRKHGDQVRYKLSINGTNSLSFNQVYRQWQVHGNLDGRYAYKMTEDTINTLQRDIFVPFAKESVRVQQQAINNVLAANLMVSIFLNLW